jgi:hypothetical protein
LSLCGNHQIVADGNVAQQLGLPNVANPNVIAILLDGRICFNSLDPLVGVASKPVRNPNVTRHLHL